MKKLIAVLACMVVIPALAFLVVGVTHADFSQSANFTSAENASNEQAILTSCDLAWRIVDSQNFGQVSGFYAVTSIASNDAWAVGNSANPNAPLLEHWNGTQWSLASPTPPVSVSHRLFGVDAVASNDVWAVGSYSDGGGTTQTLTMHWDGSLWSWILSPNGTGYYNELTSVSAISSNDIWAVGTQRFSGYISHTLTMHWDGTAWTIFPSPDVNGSSYLAGVSALSSSDVWAVGASSPIGTAQPFMLHWNGSAWIVVSGPTLTWGGHLQSVTAISPGDVWAVGDYSETSASYYNRTLTMHWDGTTWSIVPSPNVGSGDNHLWAVTGMASNDVWAVGDYLAPSVPRGLAMHWTGSTWNIATTPDPEPNPIPTPSATPPSNWFSGVAMSASSDVWAVGYFEPAGQPRTLIEHYSTSGCETATPTPTGTITPTPTRTPTATPTSSCPLAWVTIPSLSYNGANQFKNVETISSNDIWAVGVAITGSTDGILEHWDGTQWRFVSDDNPGYAERFEDISAVSSNDVWLVGWYRGSFSGTLTEHWDGTQWNYVPSPNGGGGTWTSLNAVSARTTDDIWAVGATDTAGGQPLILHGDGTGWAVVSSPDVGAGAYLTDVTALASDDAWAVGASPNGPFVLHWNGTVWSLSSIPALVGGSFLSGVVGISPNDVWAVGYSAYKTLTMHWDGATWSIVPSLNIGSEPNYLYGIDALASNDIWAVGKHTPSGVDQTLTLHWDGAAWTIVPSPSPNFGASYLGVSMLASNHVWAVGYTRNVTTTLTLSARYTPAPPCGATSTPTSTSPQASPTGTNTPHSSTTPTSTTTQVITPATATGTPTEFIATPTPEATATTCAVQFNDVPEGSTFYDNILCLACRGIISGYPDGTFRPDNDVTRGQLAKIVSNAAGYSDPQTIQMFEDVPVGSTFFDFVGRLASRALLGGYSCGGSAEPCVPPGNLPYFRPNNSATRGQISKIVSNAAGYADPPGVQIFKDIPPDSTFYDYVQRLASRGYVNGYPCGGDGEPCVEPLHRPYFRPGNNATRGQISKIVSMTFFPACPTP